MISKFDPFQSSNKPLWYFIKHAEIVYCFGAQHLKCIRFEKRDTLKPFEKLCFIIKVQIFTIFHPKYERKQHFQHANKQVSFMFKSNFSNVLKVSFFSELNTLKSFAVSKYMNEQC